MTGISKGKQGDLKTVAGGVIALIVILLLIKLYAPAKAYANTGFETADKVEGDLGLSDLILIPKAVSNTLSLNSEKALVATFKLNKDGKELVTDGGNIRVIFSYRKLPEDALRDVCTNFRVPADGSGQDDANNAKGFDCDVSDENSKISGGSLKTAILNGWANGAENPAPGGEYRAIVFIKGKNDKDFIEGKESETYRFFDDAFIETYNGGVKAECVTKGLGKDPKGLHDCNVYAQKREELAALENQPEKRKKILAALEKSEVGEICKYEKTGGLEWVPLLGKFVTKYWLSDECTPEEVDGVWKNYLVDDGRADDYSCKNACTSRLWSGAYNVCKVKRQVVKTLPTAGWDDGRANKGWEDCV